MQVLSGVSSSIFQTKHAPQLVWILSFMLISGSLPLFAAPGIYATALLASVCPAEDKTHSEKETQYLPKSFTYQCVLIRVLHMAFHPFVRSITRNVLAPGQSYTGIRDHVSTALSTSQSYLAVTLFSAKQPVQVHLRATGTMTKTTWQTDFPMLSLLPQICRHTQIALQRLVQQ